MELQLKEDISEDSVLKGTIVPRVDNVQISLFTLQGNECIDSILDPTNSFTFTDLKPGPYLLQAKSDSSWEELTVTLNKSEVKEVVITMKPNVMVSGTIILGSRQISQGLISFEPTSKINSFSNPEFNITNGSFSGSLKPDTYDIFFLINRDKFLIENNKKFSQGEKKELSYSFDTGTAVIHILKNGHPIEKGFIYIYSTENKKTEVRREFQRGKLILNNFPVGTYNAIFLLNNHYSRTIQINIEAGKNLEFTLEAEDPPEPVPATLEVRLPDGKIPDSFSVYFEVNGQPVKGWEDIETISEIIQFVLPEGVLSGTVSVSGFPIYKITPRKIEQGTENRIIIQLQQGGIILACSLKTKVEIDVHPVDPNNPVSFDGFNNTGEADSSALLKLANSEKEESLILEGFSGRSNVLPPGDYKVSWKNGYIKQERFVHVEFGKVSTLMLDSED